MKNTILSVILYLLFFSGLNGQEIHREMRLVGYRILLEGGYSLGRGKEAPNDFNFTFSNGFYLERLPLVYMGAGAAMVCYPDWETAIVPVFAHIRINLKDNPTTPFADFRIGYSFGEYEGFYLSPSLGIKFKIAPLCDFYLNLGYTFQRMFASYYDEDGFHRRDFEDNLHAVNFKVGFEI